MDGASTDFVDGEDGEPVSWKGAGAYEYDLSGRGVAEHVVEVVASVEAHCGEEGSGREAEAVESEVEEAKGMLVTLLRGRWNGSERALGFELSGGG